MGYEERMEAANDYIAERAQEIYGGLSPEELQGCCEELEELREKLINWISVDGTLEGVLAIVEALL